MQQALQVVYDQAGDRLLAYVPHAVSPMQLRMIAQAAERIDRVRWEQTPPGDRKEILGRKLRAYEAGRVEQCVAKKAGTVDFFKATVGTGKIISLGA